MCLVVLTAVASRYNRQCKYYNQLSAALCTYYYCCKLNAQEGRRAGYLYCGTTLPPCPNPVASVTVPHAAALPLTGQPVSGKVYMGLRLWMPYRLPAVSAGLLMMCTCFPCQLYFFFQYYTLRETFTTHNLAAAAAKLGGKSVILSRIKRRCESCGVAVCIKTKTQLLLLRCIYIPSTPTRIKTHTGRRP